MKVFIVFLVCAIVACSARPQNQQQADQYAQGGGAGNSAGGNGVSIVNESFDNTGINGYKFNYELSDGQKRDETAVVNNLGAENESIAITGSYSFVAPDGQTYSVNYKADENGFQPEAAHIPKA